MNLYHDVSGWTLVFAVLVCAVICDAFGIWMGRLSTH
jgi:CDP-diglyceride synthetase